MATWTAHIRAGGVDREVALVETPTIVPSIVAADARAATLKLTSR